MRTNHEFGSEALNVCEQINSIRKEEEPLVRVIKMEKGLHITC